MGSDYNSVAAGGHPPRFCYVEPAIGKGELLKQLMIWVAAGDQIRQQVKDVLFFDDCVKQLLRHGRKP